MTTIDKTSFQQQLVEAQDDLLHFAQKLSPDKEVANDLLQETYLKALNNEDKYLPDTNFRAWLYTIMRNTFINNCRKEVRDQNFADHPDNTMQIHAEENSTSTLSEYSYDIQEIYRLINAQSDDYRVPFTMHISGFKYREIADKLNLPLGTVKSRIYTTRQILQDVFKDLK